MSYNSFLYLKIIEPLFDLFSEIKWEGLKEKITGRRFNLTKNEWEYISKLLEQDYYIILNRRNAHLTTYLICLADWLKRPRLSWPHYSHACGNIVVGVGQKEMLIIESIKGGVRKSKFEDVFNCDSAALLKPKKYLRDIFREFMKNYYVPELVEDIGRPYDDLLNMADQSKMSCVEVIRDGLRQLPEYDDKMAEFEKMIWDVRNLTPQMFYDCSDFEVVYEIRR